MNTDELSKVHEARPFVPFTIHLNDGRNLHVPHPEHMSHIPNSRVAVVHDLEIGVEIIDILAITSIAVGRNGSRRRPPRQKKKRS